MILGKTICQQYKVLFHLPNVSFDVRSVAVWFYMWRHIQDKGKVFHLHDPFDVVLVAIWYETPIRQIERGIGIGKTSIDIINIQYYTNFHSYNENE